MDNRLAGEKSPYLLQHRTNPVEWYPWGEEAFEVATKLDRPVFLSIGYATCHWCHVMAHESFEDEEVADLMNSTFINIKVDREERPDIDSTYMRVCQILTGQGGWPLNLVLTPDKRPFFAATYIPKENRFNRIGMTRLIPKIAKAWDEERDRIHKAADNLVDKYRESFTYDQSGSPDKQTIRRAFEDFRSRYDEEWGGFGTPPKFPSPHNLLFLFACSRHTSPESAMNMACNTLEKMRLGGLFDQIGFGFHRYSTDERWHVPHFEKMLYDQALLMLAFTEGWRRTGDNLFLNTVEEIARYVDEQMTSPEGAYYSAEDADSDGEEGRYYQWTHGEIHQHLSREEAILITQLYNISQSGNFLDESTGRRNGANILWLRSRPEKLADAFGMSPADLIRLKNEADRKLKTVRRSRTKPALDDKQLTDWNSWMIAALARSGAVIGDSSMVKKAVRAWTRVESILKQPDGHYLHSYRDGKSTVPGMADDYALLQFAALELYQATFHSEYLERALEFQSLLDRHFLDKKNGGYFFTSREEDSLLGPHKQIYDGATPSSNSVMANNLVTLYRLTGQPEFDERAHSLFESFSGHFERNPELSAFALLALDRVVNRSLEIVISTRTYDSQSEKMVELIRSTAVDPFVILVKTSANSEKLKKLAPYTDHIPVHDRPTAWICRDFSCEQPIHSLESLKNSLLIHAGN